MSGVTRAAAVVAVAVVLVSGGGSTAHAQTREADAERLFREGQKLMEERRYGEACPKFEAAYKKDLALGTLINLAFCHKEQGAIWYAWLEFREAELKAIELNRADRRDFARGRLAELEKSLPKVIIDNPQKPERPLTEVRVEDRRVWEAERGAVFAAEGGQRKFTFFAKGKKQANVIIMVARGDRAQHVAVPEMEDATADDVPPPPVAPIEPPKRDAVTPSSSSGSAERTIGWVAIGVGSGAAVLGTVMGALTIFGTCGADCHGTRRDNASTVAATSTVSFAVAGVLVGGGLVLLLTAPPSKPAVAASGPRSAEGSRGPRVLLTPSVGPTWAGLSGTF